MKKNTGSSSWSYNKMLLKLASIGWQRLFDLEKSLKRKIFIHEFDPRKDDICVATYMRSGTTLLQMVLYQLLTEGDMNFKHMSDISPLLEDAIQSGNILRDLSSPRFFKTHGDYKYFPEKINGKIIYGVRNGMDVAASMFHYYKDYNMPDLQWDRFLNKVFMERISWFKHVAEWMENRHHFNIFYVRYEDLTQDTRKTVEKLAAFLNVKPSEEVLRRVEERCSFEYMKQYQEKFGRARLSPNKTDDQFLRKGESNKGQLEFTGEQRAKFEELYNKYLSRYNLGYDFSAIEPQVRKMFA